MRFGGRVLLIWVLAGAGAWGQDDPIPGLIERLGASDIDDRDKATRELRALGEAALPALEEASRSPDPEVAARARQLRRMVVIAAKLTPELRKAMPGVEDRLARGDEHEWTSVFMEALANDAQGQQRLHPELGPADLNPLMTNAVWGASTDPERTLVYTWIREHKVVCVLPVLVDLLREGKGEFTGYAASAIADLTDGQGVPELVFLLRDERPVVRRDAVCVVGQLTNKSMLPHVLPLLKDEDASVRQGAISAVGRFDGEKFIPRVLPMLKDPDPGVRLAVLGALRWEEGKDVEAGIMEMLADPSVRVRERAVEMANESGIIPAVPQLIRLIDDKEFSVRVRAIDAVAALQAGESVPVLVRALDDNEDGIRQRALRAIARLNTPEGVAAVIALLEAKTPKFHVVSLTDALANMTAPQAGPLVAKLFAADPANEHFLSTLIALKVKDAVPALVERLDPKYAGKYDPVQGLFSSMHDKALNGLGRLDAVEAAPAVRRFLQQPFCFGSRGCAVRVLGRLEGKASVAFLLELLKKAEGEEVRREAADVLAAFGLPEVAAEMSRLFKDGGDEKLQGIALIALARMRVKESIPALLDVLQRWPDVDADFLDRVVDVLGDMDAREAVPALEVLIEDEEFRPCRQAAAALCKLGSLHGIPLLLGDAEEPAGASLFWLNALRQPQAWAKLREKILSADLSGWPEEIAEQLEKAAGMPIEGVPVPFPEWSDSRGYFEWWVRPIPMSVLSALERMFPDYRRLGVVLEPDGIRILPRDEELAFWKAWWAEEQGKRKR